MCGNTNKLSDGGVKSEKSYLFFLTVYHPGIGLTGDRVISLGKHLNFEVFGAFTTSLEKLRASIIRTPSRTHNRIRSPRQIRSVTSGKGLALRVE